MPRTILCVFAHPDDEATVGPLLAMEALNRSRVVVVSVTSGQIGVTANANLKAGDELGAARTQELRRACASLGIDEPIVLPFVDGAIAHRRTVDEIVEELRRLFHQLRPDEVITFGPDGASGHTDHRIVSAAATQVFHEPGVPAGKLYYLSYPHSLLHDCESPLKAALLSRLVDDAFVSLGQLEPRVVGRQSPSAPGRLPIVT